MGVELNEMESDLFRFVQSFASQMDQEARLQDLRIKIVEGDPV